MNHISHWIKTIFLVEIILTNIFLLIFSKSLYSTPKLFLENLNSDYQIYLDKILGNQDYISNNEQFSIIKDSVIKNFNHLSLQSNVSEEAIKKIKSISHKNYYELEILINQYIQPDSLYFIIYPLYIEKFDNYILDIWAGSIYKLFRTKTSTDICSIVQLNNMTINGVKNEINAKKFPAFIKSNRYSVTNLILKRVAIKLDAYNSDIDILKYIFEFILKNDNGKQLTKEFTLDMKQNLYDYILLKNKNIFYHWGDKNKILEVLSFYYLFAQDICKKNKINSELQYRQNINALENSILEILINSTENHEIEHLEGKDEIEAYLHSIYNSVSAYPALWKIFYLSSFKEDEKNNYNKYGNARNYIISELNKYSNKYYKKSLKSLHENEIKLLAKKINKNNS